MTTTEFTYKEATVLLATALDCEGSIIFSLKENEHINLRCEISNKNLELLERVKKLAGLGYVSKPNPIGVRSWRIEGENVGVFLIRVKDYLIVKERKAELAILIAETLEQKPNSLSNEKRLLRWKLYELWEQL